MKNILITNHGSSLNLGDAALLNSPLEMIRDISYNSRISIITNDPYNIPNEDKLNIHIDPLQYPLYFKTYKTLDKLDLLNDLKIKDIFMNSNRIIIRGGDGLSSVYGNLSLLLRSIQSYPALKYNKPLAFFGHTFAPLYFTGLFGRWAKKILLNELQHSSFITVREKISKEQLKKYGINEEKIYVTPDVGFSLKYHHKNIVKKSYNNIFNENNNILGITNSYSLYKYVNKNQCSYEKYFAKIIDKIIQKLNMSILLIPHSFIPGKDDRTINNKIYFNIQNKKNVYCINDVLTPEMGKSIIGACNMLVSLGRYHPIVHSIDTNVPSIGLDYSHRISGLLSSIDRAHLAFNIKNFKPLDFINEILTVWKNRENHKSILLDKNKIISKGTKKNIELLRNFIKNE